MRKFIKKADIILIVSILTISITLAFIQTKILSDKYSNTAKVKITINNKTFGTYSLNKPKEIAINNHFKNIIEISKAKYDKNDLKKDYQFIVKMKSAKCPGEDCVHHSPISLNGQSIVCLPAKLIVEITKEKGNQHIDGYTY